MNTVRLQWPDGLGEVRELLDGYFRRNPFPMLLGIELTGWGPGWATARMTPAPSLRNLAGSIHGGAISSLADVAFEVACNSYGRECLALDLTAHFTAPASGEPLVAAAEEMTRSRRTASYRVTVSEGERTVAWFLAVAYRTDRWRGGEERYPTAWRDGH